MSMEAIESYFKSNVFKPFFMMVGDEEYRNLKSKLSEVGDIEFVRLSSFCRSGDKKPDLDKLKETLRMADVDCQTNRIVLIGLGEYLALEGVNKANQILSELLTFNLGSAHVVFLLRGISDVIRSLVGSDPRLSGRQIAVCDNTLTQLSFMLSSPELEMYPCKGIKELLVEVEDGDKDKICVNTMFEFSDSILPVQVIKNPYEAICRIEKTFSVPKNYGTEDEWSELLIEVNKKHSMHEVFNEHGFDDSYDDFYMKLTGSEYHSWLYYLFLLSKRDKEKNPYIKYVLNNSSDFQDFRYKVVNAISDVSVTSSDYPVFYLARKKLIKQYPDAEIAAFVANNRFNAEQSIYKLTDNTLVEREEIIANIAQHGIPKELAHIYPDLALYLKKYHFHGDTLSDLLTDYFEEYKKQKVLNSLDEVFVERVDQLAINREYNRLRTRDELVSGLNQDSSFLCWIDALGVEYLSFIVGLAQKHGLATSVAVGRASLPTITSINKSFYDQWPDDFKRKIEDLDDIKHSEKGGYKYGPSSQYPIHLAKELKVIADAIEEAATDLGLRKYDRYVIASDHGASRLAVIRKKEEKYETDTQGEHSGRCCKSFDGYELPFATEENGYIILADYGRFKKSRAANVEVHGGASLEEVLVPVITLSLKDSSIEIKVVEETIKADYKTGATIRLFVNKRISQPLTLEYRGVRYSAKLVDDYHYSVDVDAIKRAGIVEADIYLAEDLVSHISVRAVGKSASMNSDFDDLL